MGFNMCIDARGQEYVYTCCPIRFGALPWFHLAHDLSVAASLGLANDIIRNRSNILALADMNR